MERKNRNWFYLVPVAGAVFCLWYLYTSFYDVVYSDYIRLVNSYLPDVWNPAKFWVPDLLTRVPVNFLARIINTTFFHYSIRHLLPDTPAQISVEAGSQAEWYHTARFCQWHLPDGSRSLVRRMHHHLH